MNTIELDLYDLSAITRVLESLAETDALVIATPAERGAFEEALYKAFRHTIPFLSFEHFACAYAHAAMLRDQTRRQLAEYA